MSIALAFDIYGTLIDPHGVVTELQNHIGDRAAECVKSSSSTPGAAA
jgi:2-haloacid dehalogenase